MASKGATSKSPKTIKSKKPSKLTKSKLGGERLSIED